MEIGVLEEQNMKTVDYLDAVKAAYALTSDYQLSKKIGESSSRISQYRVGRTFMDDDLAIKIAYMLDLNPLTVLADAHIEREERRGSNNLVIFWQEVKKSGQMDVKVLSKMVA
jgi:ribosome-binding protein aMBF1 (putative translation factor)